MSESEPTLEQQALTKAGFGQLATELLPGTQVQGKDFLQAYRSQEVAEGTRLILESFVDMPETDPDYPESLGMMVAFVRSRFKIAEE